MARPLRIEYAHAIYHVTSRGNARQALAPSGPVGSSGAHRRLTWLGLVGSGDADAVYWLDNRRIQHLPRPGR